MFIANLWKKIADFVASCFAPAAPKPETHESSRLTLASPSAATAPPVAAVEPQPSAADDDDGQRERSGALKGCCSCIGRAPGTPEGDTSKPSRFSNALCLAPRTADDAADAPQDATADNNDDVVPEGNIDELLASHVDAVPECGFTAQRASHCGELPPGDSRSASDASSPASDTDSAKDSIKSIDYQEDSYIDFMRGMPGPKSVRKNVPDGLSSDEGTVSVEDFLAEDQ